MRVLTIGRIAAVAAIMVFGLSACGDSDDSDDSPETSTPAITEQSSAAPSDEPQTTDEAGEGCYVHLFESDDFDESDDHFKLSQPGKYENLRDLPGANDDWTDDADSIKVGPDATVTIWTDTDFSGTSTKLEPGSEHADVDDEPSSLEMTC